jgi:hypothetical protein
MKLNASELTALIGKRSKDLLGSLAHADHETILCILAAMAEEAEDVIGDHTPRKPFDTHTGDHTQN